MTISMMLPVMTSSPEVFVLITIIAIIILIILLLSYLNVRFVVHSINNIIPSSCVIVCIIESVCVKSTNICFSQ